MEVNDPNKLPFGKIPYLRFCLERIANVSVFNNTYDFDITPVHGTFDITEKFSVPGIIFTCKFKGLHCFQAKRFQIVTH